MRDFEQRRRQMMQAGVMASAGALAGLALGGQPAAAQQQRQGSQQAGGTQRQQASNLPDPTSRQGNYAEVNGARIFWQSTGQGEPMLLLHGYPLSGALFARVRDGLAARHRVVTIDHRGYGSSEAPDTPGSIEVYARDALAVMQQIGLERAIVAGMSMGGPITLEMYRQSPERFNGMALIDTIAAAANPAEAGLWNGVAEMVRQNGVEAILPVLMKEMLTGDTRTNQPAFVTYLETVMKQATRDAAVGGANALAKRSDYSDLLGQIRVPTLVYVGLEDSVYPVEIAERMQQQIGGSTLEVIPDAAHAAIFENPEPSVQALLGWANAALGARTGSNR